MPTDLVFNPAAADEARRNKALPEPTQHRVSPPSPDGQGPLDPTYAITTDKSGPFDAVASDRERREMRRAHGVASRTENAAELAYRWADAGPILYATHKTSISNHGVLCGLCPNGRVWVRTYFFIFDAMPMPLPEPTLFFPQKLTLFANGRNKVFVEEMNANRDPVSNALGAYQAAAPDSDLDQMQPAQKGWALATRIMALSTQRGEMVAPPYHTLTIGNPA